MKTKPQPKNLLLVCTLLFFVFQTKSFAGPSNFTWTGTTSTSWTTSTNWSPNGVPSTSDTVTIVSGSRDVSLSGNITVKKFTITSGTVYLNDFTLTITTHATFTSGTITAGAGRLVVSSATSTTFSGTTFSVPTTITSNAVYLNGSTFNDSLTITKNGNSNDNSKGGNLYKKQFLLTNSAKGAFVLSDSFPDTYEKKLIIKNTNEGTVYLAHRASGTVFKDDVTFYGKNIYSNYYGTAEYQGNIILNCPAGNVYFGYGSGSSTLANTKRLQLGDSAFAAGKLTLMHFTKLGTDGEINLTLTGSAILTFESGTVINSTIAISSPTLYLHGARFNNLADLTVTGTSTASSEGGCYFAADAKITNNSSGTNSFALGNTVPDTFATTSTITNTKGTLSMNNAVFVGNTILKNVETSTNSDRFIIASTGNCIFQGNIQIQNSVSGFCFGKTSGTASLASGKTLSFVSGFTGNLTLKNFTQQGSTAQSFSFTSTGQKLFLGPGSTFNGNFDFSGHFIILNGTTFNGTATINRYGAVPDTCAGGNVFNSTTIIKDSTNAAYSYLMAYTNADDYNGDVTFIQKGSGAILYPCYNKNSTFAGNITVNSNSAFQFGGNGGKVILDGTTNQNLSNLSSYPVTMKKLQINKTANSFTLNFPLTVSDSLILTQGRINTDTLNLLSISNGGKLSGGSDNSYVNGPMKKTGNSAFVFPLGSSALTHPYHPLEITTPASTSDAYTANYFSTSQTIGSAIDTSIDNLNACQYWKLNRNTGTSKVKVKLSWNNDSCETISPVDMRVVGWDDSKWKDFHSSSYSGNKSIGTSTSADSTNTISVFTLAYRRCAGFTGVLTSNNITCHGDQNGTVSIRVSRGLLPYKYTWSHNLGASSSTPPILEVGTYFVNVIDSLGCQIYDTAMIVEPDSMQISFTKSNSSCYDSSGETEVSVLGGNGMLKTYKWIGIDSEQSHLTNLPGGEFTVMVRDSLGCTIYGSVQIGNYDGPIISVTSIQGTSCYNSNDGAILTSVSGGTVPYSYKWSGTENSNDSNLSDARGGIYLFEVIDSVGCISFDTLEIPRPEIFTLEILKINTNCGIDTGSATANVNGGTSPYIFDWSIGDVDSFYIHELPTGDYNLTVSDANNCKVSGQFDILNSGDLTVEGHIINNETCFLDSSGKARVTVSGGEGPYTYSWFPRGGENDTASNLVSDYYTVTVIDNNGCIQRTKLLIESPPQIDAYIETTSPSAIGNADGIEKVIVWGGNAPFTYEWNLGSNSNIIVDWNNTQDTVTVTDNSGCKTIAISNVSYTFTCYIGANPVSSGCGPYTFNCPACTTAVTRNIVDDFGAVGDGITDNECAFEEASAFLNSLPPSLEKTLIIPLGTYLVGAQDQPWHPDFDAVLYFNDISNLTIHGELVYNVIWVHGHPVVTGYSIPEIKYKDCLKYGAFDLLGNPDNRYLDGDREPSCIGNYYCRIMTPGTMIRLNHCANVRVENLNLNGNLDNIIIGGGWTDGMQIPFDGIFINASRNVTLELLNVHDFGHDGIVVYYKECSSISPPPDISIAPILNLNINNSKFLFNGRCAMTWGSGWGVHAFNSEFSYTGQGRLNMAANAGIDLEYEGGNKINQNGTFDNCSIRFNKAYGVTVNGGSAVTPVFGRHVRFNFCDIVGSGNGAAAVVNGRNWEFYRCDLYGKVQQAPFAAIAAGTINFENLRFINCNFSERYADSDISPLVEYSFAAEANDEVTPGPVFDATCPQPIHRPLIDFSNSCRVEFTDCNIRSFFTQKLIWISQQAPAPNDDSFNRFTNVGLDSYGLNGCGCDADLTSIVTTHMIGNNYFHSPAILSYRPITCSVAYYSATINISAADALNFEYGPAVGIYNSHAPLVDKYHDVIDPNAETHLFPVAGEPDPLIIAPTYPPCIYSSMRSSKPSENSDFENSNVIIVSPNPAIQNVMINGVEIGEKIQIINSIGSIILEKKVSSSNFEIEISNLVAGIYIIITENKKSFKFIKL